MSIQALTDRIRTDAEAEAEEILRAAKERAEAEVKQAEEDAAHEREKEEAAVAERIRAMDEGSAASLRLEAKKIALAARRRVIDGIYARALDALNSLGEAQTLALFSRLLDEYAEEGDEVVLPEKFAYTIKADEIARKKKLSIARERANIDGGFILRGKMTDRDVSYAALLARDREEYQSELARKLFQLQ